MEKSKALVLAFIGGLSGFVTWLIGEAMCARIPPMPKSHVSVQATLYWWFVHPLFGAVIAGAFALLLSLGRMSWVRSVLACIVGICLGPVFVSGVNALCDIAWSNRYGESYWISGGETWISSLVWNLAVSLTVTFTVAVAIAPTRVYWTALFDDPTLSFRRYSIMPTQQQVARAALAGLAAGIMAFGLHTVLDRPLQSSFHVAKTDYAEAHNGKVLSSPWRPFNPARLFDFLGLGLSIGLCVGIADRLFRKAYIRLIFPGYRFCDIPLEGSCNTIGARYESNIAILDDPNILDNHAFIEQCGDNFTLVDGQSAIGTYLNGISVRQAPLQHGDVIVVGQQPMQFLLLNAKSTPTPVYGVAAYGEMSIPEAVAAPQHRLVDESGLELPLQTGKTAIGRDAGADVSITYDRTVSRMHAEIVVDDGKVFVTDLKSKTGTRVNGTLVDQAHPLHSGDKLKFGETEFFYYS